jgi:hypothetical protein
MQIGWFILYTVLIGLSAYCAYFACRNVVYCWILSILNFWAFCSVQCMLHVQSLCIFCTSILDNSRLSPSICQSFLQPKHTQAMSSFQQAPKYNPVQMVCTSVGPLLWEVQYWEDLFIQSLGTAEKVSKNSRWKCAEHPLILHVERIKDSRQLIFLGDTDRQFCGADAW